MKPNTMALAAMVMALACVSTANAGPFKDFETDMRAAYGQYRVSLFATNANKPEDAGKSLAAFTAAWQGLATRAVPPQYADDARYAETLKAVTAIAAKASSEIASGKLSEAHETLEKIRDEIADLHTRNGVVGFSDHMNAYHARMEAVLGTVSTLDAPGLRRLSGELAVLAYFAGEIVARPPADADASFTALAGDVVRSIEAARSAVITGDLAAAKAALGGLKAPYSKLFLKFG